MVGGISHPTKKSYSVVSIDLCGWPSSYDALRDLVGFVEEDCYF